MHVNVIKTHCETISSAVHVICCSDKVSAAPSAIPSKVGAIPRKDDIEYDESALTAIMGLFNVWYGRSFSNIQAKSDGRKAGAG